MKLTANVVKATLNVQDAVDLNTLPYVRIGSTSAATWNVNKGEQNTIYGDENTDPKKYVDLSGCQKIMIKQTTGNPVRVFVYGADGSTGNVTITSTSTPVKYTQEGDYWVLCTKDLINNYGKARLISVKASAYNTNATVTELKAVQYATDAQYTISGSGIQLDNVATALADPCVKVIDATGLTNTTAIELTSVNPNCIFKTTAGKLSNTKNVMIDNTIEKYSITDGYMAYVPTGATATAATYTRAAGGTYGTICLPYAVSSDANVQYYTLSSNDANTLTIETATSVEAGTPAIFKVLSGSEITASAKNVTLSVNKDGSATEKLTLKGTYTQQVFTTDLDKKYYISGDQVKQATSSLTVNPFRAYMEASEANIFSKSSAKINLFEADDVTAINAIFNSENSDVKVAEIYSINGAKQNELQKGINIVKFSNGTSKKVILK